MTPLSELLSKPKLLWSLGDDLTACVYTVGVIVAVCVVWYVVASWLEKRP